MQTKIHSAGDVNCLQYALKILQRGGLVAFPTDTVYGVGALAFNAKAVESIFTAKNRSNEKAIPILLADVSDLVKVAIEINSLAMKLALHFWPGPLTLVVLKHPGLPEVVSATPTIGVRVPDHPVARSLLQLAGPMAVTSANLSRGANPSTAQEVLAQLGGRIDLILDGGQTPGGIPSTLVDCTRMQPVILREGPVSLEQINRLIQT